MSGSVASIVKWRRIAFYILIILLALSSEEQYKMLPLIIRDYNITQRIPSEISRQVVADGWIYYTNNVNRIRIKG
jgi:hypothetical protein